MRLISALLHALAGRAPLCVCRACVRPKDELAGPAGDYALCHRCGASITSRDGVSVFSFEKEPVP